MFPLGVRAKEPMIAKRDGGNGCHDATTDLGQIHAWWAKWPDANVGVATGNGLLVLDPDGDRGALALCELCREYGELPVTRTVVTGGGFHFWYRAEGPGVRNTTGARNGLAPGLDTRGWTTSSARGTHPLARL